MVIIYLDQPSSFGAEDKLAASPWIARDHFCWPRIVFQRDSLKCLIDCHLYNQVEQIEVSVLHPEPAEEPKNDLLAGGVGGYHDCLVRQVRSQTCGVHTTLLWSCLRGCVKTIFIIDILRVYILLFLPSLLVTLAGYLGADIRPSHKLEHWLEHNWLNWEPEN